MEYLTLQDIPHRHYNPLHSHSMASASAVCSSPLNSHITYPIILPLPATPPPQSAEAKGPLCFPSNWHPTNHPTAEGDSRRSSISSTQQRSIYLINRKNSTYHENDIYDKFLTSFQNVHMRSSPPIQPNEHDHANKLPSFSEVCCVRTPRIREY
jgi:hypothetical protein